MSKPKFVIIEDDSATAEIQKALLVRAGYEVDVVLDAANSIDSLLNLKPDIVIIDIMMPGMDGLEVVRRVRLLKELAHLKIIVVSAKNYAADRERALAMGANGMLLKPVSPTTFVADVLALAADNIDLTYWGVRGTLPVPGRKTLRYGGNTSCFTVELPRDQFLILDAGSGIRELSNHIMATRSGKMAAKILITHPHWDHINALPFFVPLYIPGNEFEIMGPSQGARVMREIIGAQMDGTYFPITLKELGARVFFRNLSEEEVTFGDFTIRTMLLSHPGNCLGYRISSSGRSFCYITDNELYPKGTPGYQESFQEKLVEFVKDCDVLLIDSTYTDQEYKAHVNWGHSGVGEVAALAHAAGVKRLHLMHHDPAQSDDDIDRKLAEAQDHLARLGSKVICTAPPEGSRFRLGASGQFVELAPLFT
jgi:phosphoribosyl 1,2-cyclic phosphodiesterase/ActR/RegA family two-component response regulator